MVFYSMTSHCSYTFIRFLFSNVCFWTYIF
nr:MAG TPA: hypothetical protein [Bacteriophage sp.]